jgi:hypothetical protein
VLVLLRLAECSLHFSRKDETLIILFKLLIVIISKEATSVFCILVYAQILTIDPPTQLLQVRLLHLPGKTKTTHPLKSITQKYSQPTIAQGKQSHSGTYLHHALKQVLET